MDAINTGIIITFINKMLSRSFGQANSEVSMVDLKSDEKKVTDIKPIDTRVTKRAARISFVPLSLRTSSLSKDVLMRISPYKCSDLVKSKKISSKDFLSSVILYG